MNDNNLLGYFSLAKGLYGIDEVADMDFNRQFYFTITKDDKFVLLSESDNEISNFDIDCNLSKLMLNVVNLSDPIPGVYKYTYSTKKLEKINYKIQ